MGVFGRSKRRKQSRSHSAELVDRNPPDVLPTTSIATKPKSISFVSRSFDRISGRRRRRRRKEALLRRSLPPDEWGSTSTQSTRANPYQDHQEGPTTSTATIPARLPGWDDDVEVVGPADSLPNALGRPTPQQFLPTELAIRAEEKRWVHCAYLLQLIHGYQYLE